MPKADNGPGLRVQKRVFKRVINPETEINRFENCAIRCNIFFVFFDFCGETGTADGNPPRLSAGALPVLLRGVDFESLNSLTADEPSVKEFHRQIANLVERDELFLERLNADGTALDNPVVAEITEYDRRFESFLRRHIICDDHSLAEDGIVRLIPQGIARLVFQKSQRESRLVVHHPHSVLAILLVKR